MIHDLKINVEYLENLLSRIKKSEIRINDRDYQKGDTLKFRDYRKTVTQYHFFEVTHIHSGLGLKENYVVLSLAYVKTE